MKLKDYEIPQHGLDDGLVPEDLQQYSLKSFDLEAYQRAQKQPDPDALPGSWSSTPEPHERGFSHARNPVQTEPSQLALDVHFGPHFNLQQPLYIPASPFQSWTMPRWVATMVGLFFGSAAVLSLAFCVVLLRDPKAPPTGPQAAPMAPVATTSAAVRPSGPAPSNLMHADAALAHRVVVSRHPGVVRRQIYRSRRVASQSSSSSVAPQEAETASRRPAKDALDQLLGESSL